MCLRRLWTEHRHSNAPRNVSQHFTNYVNNGNGKRQKSNQHFFFFIVIINSFSPTPGLFSRILDFYFFLIRESNFFLSQLLHISCSKKHIKHPPLPKPISTTPFFLRPLRKICKNLPRTKKKFDDNWQLMGFLHRGNAYLTGTEKATCILWQFLFSELASCKCIFYTPPPFSLWF